jgi:hypothetical protein
MSTSIIELHLKMVEMPDDTKTYTDRAREPIRAEDQVVVSGDLKVNQTAYA